MAPVSYTHLDVYKRQVYEGGVAVNPAIIPYGSKLYIEAADASHVYGYATAVAGSLAMENCPTLPV